MTQSLFFYGTLCHIPLLEIILGRSRDQISLNAAVLADHAVHWVKDQPFPMISEEAGAEAHGLLVQGLSALDVERLNFYEGGFDYALTPINVTTEDGPVATEVYFPEPGMFTRGAIWKLADWVAQWGDMSLSAAQDAMAQFGRKTASQMAHLLPFFRARAWSQELAQEGAPADLRRNLTRDAVTLEKRSDGYADFFRFDTFDISYPHFDGTQSDTLDRGAFIAYDAALLLPYDPKRDRVMLIEQLRYGPLLRGDPLPWVLEPIAGLVDAGEAPMEAARREAVEEAGLALQDIRLMMKTYAAPGYSTEFFHCFLGLCDLDPAQEGLHGLASESEDIRTHVMSFDRAMELFDSGEINQAPLAMMLLWLARKREDLRAEA
ncbi:NUDIX domain-containing protein [Planktotalea sp.]|uniref:NUDIX domain-containing protein n=1 Tax=Planktotalea sp. TaxID=2029877 RepID=UPI00329909C2